MAFANDLIQNESANGTRRASETSFEAWLPPFSGLHRPRGIEVLSTFDEFMFKIPFNENDVSYANQDLHYKLSIPKLSTRRKNIVEVYGNEGTPLLVARRRRSLLHPFTPPIAIYDLNSTKILTVDTFQGIFCFWDSPEVQILSSSGMIGLIRLTTSHGVKTFEVLDSYSQLTFYITPNLAPHQGLQLLILGAERSFLTGAIFERREGCDYSLETFKSLSANLKALLVSFTLFIIFSKARLQFLT